MAIQIDLPEIQEHLDWLKHKLLLNSLSPKAATRTVHRGQVYLCELGKGIGSEYNKLRPCVIVQNNYSNTSAPITVIVPITHTYKNLNCFVAIADKFDINHQPVLNGYVNVSGIRTVDKARLGNYICDLSSKEMKEIDKALANHLGIYKHYAILQRIISDKEEHIKHLSALISDICQQCNIPNNKNILENLKKLLDKLDKT